MVMPVYLVGISHVAPESLKKVRAVIQKVGPDCVAVELDFGRYLALRQKFVGKKIKVKMPPGQKIVFSLLQVLQDRLAKETGVVAGEEMLVATQYARAAGAKIAFIDRDIRITAKRMFASMTVIEKLKLVGYLFAALIGLPFIGLKLDVKKIPPEEFIRQAMAELRKKFPGIYRSLVLERDAHMAFNLRILKRRFDRIVAVVGAGHVKGIAAALKASKAKSQSRRP